MNKVRGILLGIALALPLAAIGSSGELATGKSTMTSIQSGPESGRCCWVWYIGKWWCIPC
jgi:hypothetical protein